MVSTKQPPFRGGPAFGLQAACTQVSRQSFASLASLQTDSLTDQLASSVPCPFFVSAASGGDLGVALGPSLLGDVDDSEESEAGGWWWGSEKTCTQGRKRC